MMEIKLDIDKGKTLKVHWGIDTMAHGGLNDMVHHHGHWNDAGRSPDIGWTLHAE